MLKRPASTVSRELGRNGAKRVGSARLPAAPELDPPPKPAPYNAAAAQDRAGRLARKPRVKRKLVPGSAAWTAVREQFAAGLSPEQAARTLKRMNPDDATLHFSRETIYQAVYAMPRGELRAEVVALLRFGHAKRRPRTRGKDRRGQIPGAVGIHERPAEIDEKLVPGHWEGDTIQGRYNRSAVGTLVERKTLFVTLAKMNGTGAEAALEGFSGVLARIDAQHRLSMTYDRGKEMTRHAELTEKLVSRSTSPTHTALGSEESTKTPTDSCANICPKEKTSANSPRKNSTPSHGLSTQDPESPSTGNAQQKSSSQTSTSCHTGTQYSSPLHF